MKKLLAVVLTVLLATIALGGAARSLVVAQEGEFDKHVGYADEIVFKVIETMDEQVLALEKGEIDLIGDMLDPEFLPQLLGKPEVGVAYTDRQGFGHVSFNTQLFPANISEFRRATALALDKYKIVNEVWGGFAIPIDSPVPSLLGKYSIEDEIEKHYYDQDIEAAKALLKKAGFVDVDGDGWREWDPDGDGVGADLNGDGTPNDDVTIRIGGAAESTIATRCAQIVAEGLRKAGIKAIADVRNWNSLMAEFIIQGKLEAMFFGWSLGRDPDHLYDFWRSGQSYNEWIYRYHNPEYDKVVDNMMEAESEEEAVKWAKEAQWILYEDQPIIPIYQNTLLSAYRVDKWTNYVNAKGEGVPNFWTYAQVRLKEKEFGGTFRASLPEPPDTLNPLSTSSAYSWTILGLIYDGVVAVNPYTWDDMPWLAKSWNIEIVKDAKYGKVMKVTFNLIRNATWHDGKPLTADDLIFTYWLANYTSAPYFTADDHLVNVTKVNDYTVVVYDFKPGFFEFHRILTFVLPLHVWGNPATFGKTGFSPDDVRRVIDSYARTDWTKMKEELSKMFEDAGLTPDVILGWEPGVEGLVGSGPYKITEIRAGEYYVLSVYEDHPYSARKVVKPTVTPSTPTATTPAVTVTVPAPVTVKTLTFTGETFGPSELTPVLSQSAITAYILLVVMIIIGIAVALFVRRRA